MSSEPVADLEQELTLLHRRARAFSGEIAREVHPDLDAASYVLLSSVRDLEPVHASDLAELYAVDKSSISRQVGRLEQLGLIQRDVDPADARARRLVLTVEGRRRLGTATAARRARFRARLGGWEAGDVSDLARLLHQYNGAMD